MPKHSFVLNGKKVNVDIEDDVRMLWVLRDVLKVRGPKFGCGIGECYACTSLINGKSFNPCSVSVKFIKPTDEITTIEGLADTKHKGKDLHPVQEAWMKNRVPQCGFCQPGQIMSAVALINEAKKNKRKVTDADIDQIRNVCRCNTYPRIREAIKDAAKHM